MMQTEGRGVVDGAEHLLVRRRGTRCLARVGGDVRVPTAATGTGAAATGG